MRDAPVTGPRNEIDIHFEGGSNVTFERCSQNEATALSELKAKWTKFSSVDRKIRIATTTIGGFASNVELMTCLEMAIDVVSANHNPSRQKSKQE
jgi:hypothetical protein